ncbi:MAG: hypothetical protein NZ888_08305, partial [Candidatus Nitrosocaldus sp.]|nr:hypothetical protein [Candidatus Nitrosocaldus sp.]
MVNEVFGEVAKCVRKSIGGVPQIQFSVKVGRELSNMGAPIGAKANNTTKIPDVVMKGDESIKREFLGALCDDEAWIRIEPNSTQICLKVAKLVELEHDLDAYLNQLKHVFNSLGIECSTPKTDRK